MRSIKHWSFTYFCNKLKLRNYERRHPDHPWLTEEANSILSTLLKPTDTGLEWGSGRSTLWFSKKIKKLTSVENNELWYDKVKKLLDENNLTNVSLLFKESEEFINAADKFKNNCLDFVLVDGGFRGECANKIISKVKKGGFIVIDDAHRYFSFPSIIPYSLFCEHKPMSKEWNIFLKQIKNWR